MIKNTIPAIGAICLNDSLIEISIANKPNKVVNLIIGFIATEEVSLNGSLTVSPTTVASCNGVPFSQRSTSTIFLALYQQPPALAINTAWNKPNTAIAIK